MTTPNTNLQSQNQLPSGFTFDIPDASQRGIFNIQGLEKSGKTSLALSLPKPIGLIALEKRTLDTAIPYIKRGEVAVMDFTRLRLKEVSKNRQTTAVEYKEAWNQVVGAIHGVLDSPFLKSLVIDPATDYYDLGRLAHLGALQGVLSREYGIFYAELKSLFWDMYESSKSVAVVHRLQNEYIADKKTGRYVLDGWNQMPDQVQVNVTAWRNPADNSFHATIDNCGINANLNGTDWVNEMANLEMIIPMMWS